MTVADVQGDGILDLFVASGTQELPSALFLGAEDELQRAPDHPLAQVVGVRAAAWGDIDNDGLVDVYLCRDGENQLWLQGSRDQWKNVTKASATGNGKYRCSDVALLDADHDGDLDIFIANADGPTELLSNNQDGTFRPLGGERGLEFGDGGARQLLVSDLDNDRDVDLMVIRNEPPHQIFWNDRLWAYRLDQGNPCVCRCRTSWPPSPWTPTATAIRTWSASPRRGRWTCGSATPRERCPPAVSPNSTWTSAQCWPRWT